MNEEQKIISEIIRDELGALFQYKLDEMKVLKMNYLNLSLKGGKSVFFCTDPHLANAIAAVAKAVHPVLTNYKQETDNETHTH